MTKQKSKIVTSNQIGPHKDLTKIVKRYGLDYKRPMSEVSLAVIEKIIKFTNGKEVIFDFGCGIGQSSFWLANKYSDKVIIGLDKSVSRLERQNDFKNQMCATGVASSICPHLSLLTLERVTSTPHFSQTTPLCFILLYLPQIHS